MFRPSDEPTILEVSLRNADAVCKVCGEMIAGAEVICLRCQTPHHRDCWRYFGRCSTYGCGERRFATWETLEQVRRWMWVRTTAKRLLAGGLAFAFLTTFLMPRFNRSSAPRWRQGNSISELQLLSLVLEEYKMVNGVYPTTPQGLRALAPDYMRDHQILKDPWGRAYRYVHHGDGAGYTLWSFGADDEPGGNGENRDIILRKTPTSSEAEWSR